MGKPKNSSSVKLITGIISSSKKMFDDAEKLLVKAFGKTDYKSPCVNFNYTRYYEKDMGQELSRVFLSFEKLIDPARLSAIKLLTNKIESRLANSHTEGIKRPVNIDPGYLTEAKLVLASTKDYNHRIYIGKGIYAEITLCYKHKKFVPFEWTYPDYRINEYLNIFNSIRGIFMRQRSLPV